jgi:hypothetical protein
MIHGNSNYPVLIKRIPLRIWHLRDEIEAIVKARLIARKQSGEDDDSLSVDDLVQEYKRKGPLKDETAEAPAPAGGHADESEAAMAAALEVIEGGADSSEEGEAEDATEEVEAEAAEAAKEMVEGQTDAEVKHSGVVIQRRPKLETEKLIPATAILAEIDMDHMYIFSNHKFLPGQSIVIDFVVPKRFTVNADVYYCREYNMRSRIISDKKLPYRIAVKFTFLKEGERTLLRNFVTSIEPDVHASKPVPKMNKAQEADDDDFDELDDFDL